MNRIDGTAAAARPPELDYPVVYRVVTWARIVTVIAALAMGLAWTYMSFHPGYAHGRLVFNPFLIGTDVLLLALAAYLIAWALTARITLYADRFEQRKPFVHRVLRLDDIAGRKYTTGRGAGYPMIVPKSGMPFSIDTVSYGLDERFNRWFEQLPDLKKIEREKYAERVRSDTSLGATPDARMAADAARKRNFTIVSGLLGLLALALLFISLRNREHLAALFVVNVLLPAAAFLLMAFYKDQVEGPDGSKFTLLHMAVLMPVFTLALLALDHARLLHPKGVMVWGLVIGAVIVLAGISLLTAQRKAGSPLRGWIVMAVIFLPFAWVYAGSALALANRAMDTAPPRIVSTTVIGKYLNRGRHGTDYYLRVAGSAMFENRTPIRVGVYRYWKTKKGDTLCVAVHPGRLGYTWIKPVECSGATASS